VRTQYYTEKTHLIELEKDLGVKNPDYLAQKQKVDELYKHSEGELKILVATGRRISTRRPLTTPGSLRRSRSTRRGASPEPQDRPVQLARPRKKQIEMSKHPSRSPLDHEMTGNMSSAISTSPARSGTVADKPDGEHAHQRRSGYRAAIVLGFGVVFLFRSSTLIKTAVDAMQSAGSRSSESFPAFTEARSQGRRASARL